MWEAVSSSRSIPALLRPIQSNGHSFLFFALYPLPGSCRFACLNWSPAPGRGMCERAIDLRLRAGRQFCLFLIVSCRSLTAFVRFRLACGSDFHLVPRFSSCLLGRVSVPIVGARSLFAPPMFFVPCVPCFVLASAPVSSVWLGRLVVPCLPVCPRLGDSVAVPCHPIGVGFPLLATLRLILSAPPPPRRPSCFAPSRFRAVLVSVLLSFRPSPRPACRRAGR